MAKLSDVLAATAASPVEKISGVDMSTNGYCAVEAHRLPDGTIVIDSITHTQPAAQEGDKSK